MRRKLKFKEKEKRKEVRQIHRELREEFGMGPSKRDVQYMMEHDPNYVPGQGGQLQAALRSNDDGGQGAGKTSGEEEMQGPSNQEISMHMWDRMQDNYESM